MDYKRFRQVLKYGWIHAGELSKSSGINRRIIFFDILKAYYLYHMWSNQYVKESFHLLDTKQKVELGQVYKEIGLKRDCWQKDFRENWKFLREYSQLKYEVDRLRNKRNKAYAKRFNAGKGLIVEYDVNISRQHYLDGSISIGNDVLLAKHVFIDYSGTVKIGNNVQLTNGVIIETHHHAFHSDYTESRNQIVPTSLTIEDGAVIGSKAIIMPTCNRIGKHARVGAGAVVTHDIPDYAVVIGVPAKIIRYQTQ